MWSPDIRRFRFDCATLGCGPALRRPPPRIAQIHRQVPDLSGKPWVVEPSYQSAGWILRGLDLGLLALEHGTRDAYRGGYELVPRRESAGANDRWQSDHTEPDVMILDQAGKPAVPS